MTEGVTNINSCDSIPVKQKQILKVIPNNEDYNFELQFFNKKYSYKKGQQIVLYFFETNNKDSMIHFDKVLMKAAIYPNNYYLFVTQEKYSQNLQKLIHIPSLMNYNILLDKNIFPKFMQISTLPNIVVYSKVGQFLLDTHPSVKNLEFYFVEHQISRMVDIDMQYKKQLKENDSIICTITKTEQELKNCYLKKINQMHKIKNELQQNANDTKNQQYQFLLYQEANTLTVVPQLNMKLKPKNINQIHTGFMKETYLQNNQQIQQAYQQNIIKPQEQEIELQFLSPVTQEYYLNQQLLKAIQKQKSFQNIVDTNYLGQRIVQSKQVDVTKPVDITFYEKVKQQDKLIIKKISRTPHIEVVSKVTDGQSDAYAYDFSNDMQGKMEYIQNYRTYIGLEKPEAQQYDPSLRIRSVRK